MEFIYISITIYVILLFLFCVAFKKVKRFSPSLKEPKHSFSIVVPFRNEAHNLPQLLKSIEQLNYPIEKFEVILVDDESSDGYRVSSYGFRVVELKLRLPVQILIGSLQPMQIVWSRKIGYLI